MPFPCALSTKARLTGYEAGPLHMQQGILFASDGEHLLRTLETTKTLHVSNCCPGSFDQTHKPDEYVTIDQLNMAPRMPAHLPSKL